MMRPMATSRRRASSAAFTVMLPLAAAAVGVLFLGESFGSAHVVALGLALAGLLLATWPAPADQRSSPQDVSRTASTVDKP